MCSSVHSLVVFFFYNDTPISQIYTLSLHDALPIYVRTDHQRAARIRMQHGGVLHIGAGADLDRKSTRLNSSHANISYAVFCLKKKNTETLGARVGLARCAKCGRRASIE